MLARQTTLLFYICVNFNVESTQSPLCFHVTSFTREKNTPNWKSKDQIGYKQLSRTLFLWKHENLLDTSIRIKGKRYSFRPNHQTQLFYKNTCSRCVFCLTSKISNQRLNFSNKFSGCREDGLYIMSLSHFVEKLDCRRERKRKKAHALSKHLSSPGRYGI